MQLFPGRLSQHAVGDDLVDQREHRGGGWIVAVAKSRDSRVEISLVGLQQQFLPRRGIRC